MVWGRGIRAGWCWSARSARRSSSASAVPAGSASSCTSPFSVGVPGDVDADLCARGHQRARRLLGGDASPSWQRATSPSMLIGGLLLVVASWIHLGPDVGRLFLLATVMAPWSSRSTSTWSAHRLDEGGEGPRNRIGTPLRQSMPLGRLSENATIVERRNRFNRSACRRGETRAIGLARPPAPEMADRSRRGTTGGPAQCGMLTASRCPSGGREGCQHETSLSWCRSRPVGRAHPR